MPRQQLMAGWSIAATSVRIPPQCVCAGLCVAYGTRCVKGARKKRGLALLWPSLPATSKAWMAEVGSSPSSFASNLLRLWQPSRTAGAHASTPSTPTTAGSLNLGGQSSVCIKFGNWSNAWSEEEAWRKGPPSSSFRRRGSDK